MNNLLEHPKAPFGNMLWTFQTVSLEGEFSEVPEWGCPQARQREGLLLPCGPLRISALSVIVSLRSDDVLEGAS